MNSSREITVLAVEDESTDAWLLRRAFQKSGWAHRLIILTDGLEAVAYLSGDAPYADRTQFPLPTLLLLDLKMPGLTGFEVLAWLQTRPELKQLRSIVFSSSSNESDALRAVALGASEYRVKPHAFLDLVKTIGELQSRWSTTAAADSPFPPGAGPRPQR